MVHSKNMSRLYWVFVLAIVIATSSALPHKCEQRERSLTDLDLAEDALNRLKLLIPNCEDENGASNSSECSRKEKSLGIIEVALLLISDAKKNFPLCNKEPPTIVTTVEPLTNATTVEPLTNATTVEPIPEITTVSSNPRDCQDVQAAGNVTSGVYSVWPQGVKSAVRVRCDMDKDGGGWTVIQRRGNFSKLENFDRNWQDYKNGFGNLERDFWLGNDNIFALSNQGSYSLRMDMTAADNESAYDLYREFRIEDESANYKLYVTGHSGTAGRSMWKFINEMFTTKDRKNNGISEKNCAEERKGGFWYWNCNTSEDCNPNGLYNPGVENRSSVYYSTFKGLVGLSSIDMKLRRR